MSNKRMVLHDSSCESGNTTSAVCGCERRTRDYASLLKDRDFLLEQNKTLKKEREGYLPRMLNSPKGPEIVSLEAERDHYKAVLEKINTEVQEQDYGEWGKNLYKILKEILHARS